MDAVDPKKETPPPDSISRSGQFLRVAIPKPVLVDGTPAPSYAAYVRLDDVESIEVETKVITLWVTIGGVAKSFRIEQVDSKGVVQPLDQGSIDAVLYAVGVDHVIDVPTSARISRDHEVKLVTKQ